MTKSLIHYIKQLHSHTRTQSKCEWDTDSMSVILSHRHKVRQTQSLCHTGTQAETHTVTLSETKSQSHTDTYSATLLVTLWVTISNSLIVSQSPKILTFVLHSLLLTHLTATNRLPITQRERSWEDRETFLWIDVSFTWVIVWFCLVVIMMSLSIWLERRKTFSQTSSSCK